MKSNDSITECDRVSLAIYSIGVTPLINMLIGVVVTSTENQVEVFAYAEDFSAVGKLHDLGKWWDTLTIIGPNLDYYPEPKKHGLWLSHMHRSKLIRYSLKLKLRSPMKGTGTLEGQFVQLILKIPIWKKKLWNGLTYLKF